MINFQFQKHWLQWYSGYYVLYIRKQLEKKLETTEKNNKEIYGQM